jgi:hypothetical protein
MLSGHDDIFVPFRAALPEIPEAGIEDAYEKFWRYVRLAITLSEMAETPVLTDVETGGSVTAGQVEPRPSKNTG